MSPLKDWLNLLSEKCHSVCSNIWKVSFVTTVLILMPLTRKLSGKYICELLVLFHRGENKQTAEEINPFPTLKLNKHEIVWKQHTTFFNRARDNSKIYVVTKAFFALKEKNWYYLKYNCYCPLRRECGIARMNLNSRTDCIMVTMLELMRLTCCVLTHGKALNVRVLLCIKCIVYLTCSYTNVNQSAQALRANWFRS